MRAALLFSLVLGAPALAAAQECTTNAQSVVDAAYRQILERPANSASATWVTQLSNGQISVRQLVREIANSTEHRQRFLNGDANNVVTQLYRHLLGRSPDPEGLNAHVREFANRNPEPIIDSLINSPEYQQAFGNDMVPGSRVRYCGAGVTAPITAAGRMRFQGLDQNSNGSIERNEWNGTRRSFNVHDWNADGVLSGDEVAVGAQRRSRATAEEDFDPAGSTSWTPENFRQLDRNNDNRVTSSEWFHNAEFFRRADRNRDGSLTLNEFTDTAMDDDRDDAFVNLDVNNNGRVERSEWHGSLDAFQWLDRNNDNVLSRAEVVGEGSGTFDSFAVLDANGNGSLAVNEWRWSRRSFDQYDTNRDGRLTRQEFAASGGAPTTVR